jgi:hypothetical protein
MQTDDGAALRSHEIAHRDADRPAELARLRHDLIRRVLARGPADLRNGFHLLHGLEELHPDGDRAQPQVPIQPFDDPVPVVVFGAHRC